MDLPLLLHPSAAGLSFAAAAVAAGAPLFSDGLRSLRLGRLFASLRETSLAETPTGFVHVRGEVTLESPLFAPLSSIPCAGYRLEVRGVGTPVARSIDVFRPFRLTAGETSARVHTSRARWELSETASRDVAPGQPLSQNLEALLVRVPEALWLRRSGVTLRLTERALVVGSACHVVGYARTGAMYEAQIEAELARTGTDDDVTTGVIVATQASDTSAAELRLDSGDHLSFLLVSDRAPEPGQLTIARLRTAGIVVGPVLSLLGMLYFAHTADYLRSLGSP